MNVVAVVLQYRELVFICACVIGLYYMTCHM